MTIVFENKVYEDKKQALTEFAFCHYPITLSIDGKTMTFEWFSDLEKYILTHSIEGLSNKNDLVKTHLCFYEVVFYFSATSTSDGREAT